MISNVEIIFRLVLSALLGGFIGMEREANNRPAGLRTHVLVTLGSALIMLISIHGFDGLGSNGEGGEPARLAAQVVSGIGFLGAGTIMRTGNNIKGLTTAASLWVCGGLGLAIGSGYYLGGVVTGIIALFTLMSLGVIEKRLFIQKYKLLIINCFERTGLVGEIGTVLGSHSIAIKNIKIMSEDEDEDNDAMQIQVMIKIPNTLSRTDFLNDIRNITGVENVEFDGKESVLSL